jgi:hypothetical protein
VRHAAALIQLRDAGFHLIELPAFRLDEGGNRLRGEVVALDAEGRPSFNALQNYGASAARLVLLVVAPPNR